MPKEFIRPTGRAILENIPRDILNLGLGSELIYSFVIIVTSLIIYFSTKELYELTEHQGIKYFRLAFLFFAIAYFFRSFIIFIIRYFNVGRILDLSPKFFGPLTLFIFMYASTIAILYLLYSLIWKKLGEDRLYVFHIVAILISLFSVMTRSIGIILWIQASLFIFVIIIGYLSQKDKEKSKKNKLYITYILLFIFWMINILDILIPDFFRLTKLFMYFASIGIFLVILYKVARNTI